MGSVFGRIEAWVWSCVFTCDVVSKIYHFCAIYKLATKVNIRHVNLQYFGKYIRVFSGCTLYLLMFY